jgi:hypothetical protein
MTLSKSNSAKSTIASTKTNRTGVSTKQYVAIGKKLAAKKATKKVATKKATKKVATKKAPVKKATEREFVNKALFLVKLTKTNPRKEGSIGHHSFSLIKTGMTVEQFQEKGGRLKDMHWDIRHDYLKLVNRKPKAA